MAERRATNKYYPPDWDPSKGSINTFKKSHPLRDRAKKLDRGILVVRFEMPFNVWCLGCNNHIGRGVRYNAEKFKVGNYYTTPIYEFKMKCHLCDNYILIKTDPSNFDYLIISGAKRQAEKKIDDEDDTEYQGTSRQFEFERAEEARRRLGDSMFKLEKKLEDKLSGEANQPNLMDIRKWRSKTKDSFLANQVIRAQYRRKRKSLEEAKERDERLLKRASLKITLIKPSSSDTITAKKMIKDFVSDRALRNEQSKRRDILNTNRFIPRPTIEYKREHSVRRCSARMILKKE